MNADCLNFKYVPKSKRRKQEHNVKEQCKGTKSNGDQCLFSQAKGSLYCCHHLPKSEMVDSYTNTEGNILDITTANKLILEFIDDKVEYEHTMSELLELYNLLKKELDVIKSI